MNYKVNCHAPREAAAGAEPAVGTADGDPGSAVGAEDGEVTIDIVDGRANVSLSGDVGPRAASVLRSSLEAMDGLPGPIELDGTHVTAASPGVALVLLEAEARRRSLGFADIRMTAPADPLDELLPRCGSCGATVLNSEASHPCRS